MVCICNVDIWNSLDGGVLRRFKDGIWTIDD